MKNFIRLMIIVLIAITVHNCRKNRTEARITIDTTSLDSTFINAIPSEGGSGEIKFESALDWEITTTDTKASSWLGVEPTYGVAGAATITITASKNDRPIDRQTIISIASGTFIHDINITQIGRPENLELIALYNATGGENWTNNTNWGSDKPLNTWYGITTAKERVTRLLLSNNNLTGSIPAVIGDLSKLTYLELSGNQLKGTIPSAVLEHAAWESWRTIINQQEGYGFNLTGIKLPGIKGNLIDINGEAIYFSEIYSKNKYTVLLSWDPNGATSRSLIIDKLSPAYQQKRLEGLEVIAYTSENANSFIEQNGLGGWNNFNTVENSNATLLIGDNPKAEVMDQNGNVIFTYMENKDSDSRFGKSAPSDLTPLLENKFGVIDFSADYESTDYTKDGKVLTLQTATYGSGINIVIVGDAFSDKDMGTNGKYVQRMNEGMEHFFSEEPYKSFRNRYNVYTVKAISKNEVYNSGSSTIFECQFGGGTLITGNNNKVFEYASKVPSINTTNDLTVITILNSPTYAGTCYMYYNNASISYCPIVNFQDEAYRQIVTHEAGGHGFAKLADEYYYQGNITAAAISVYQELKEMDWQANTDITSDPNNIRWTHFLTDSRYANKVGIFEGALGYSNGAYRPSSQSIMRLNTGGYNAPSREAIFKRIITLSGGTYYYEDFATYDAINRTANAIRARRTQAEKVDQSKFIPLAPPVIMKSNPQIPKVSHP